VFTFPFVLFVRFHFILRELNRLWQGYRLTCACFFSLWTRRLPVKRLLKLAQRGSPQKIRWSTFIQHVQLHSAKFLLGASKRQLRFLIFASPTNQDQRLNPPRASTTQSQSSPARALRDQVPQECRWSNTRPLGLLVHWMSWCVVPDSLWRSCSTVSAPQRLMLGSLRPTPSPDPSYHWTCNSVKGDIQAYLTRNFYRIIFYLNLFLCLMFLLFFVSLFFVFFSARCSRQDGLMPDFEMRIFTLAAVSRKHLGSRGWQQMLCQLFLCKKQRCSASVVTGAAAAAAVSDEGPLGFTSNTVIATYKHTENEMNSIGQSSATAATGGAEREWSLRVKKTVYICCLVLLSAIYTCW